MNDSGWTSVEDTYDRMLKLVKSERFLKMQGLGNEVPFFICPYPPKAAVKMERMREKLVNKLEQGGIRILEINLYDLSVELLKADGDWHYVEEETTMPKDILLEQLQNILDVEHVLAPAIARRVTEIEHDVLFISGIGEVFPFIRSHNILNNLQSKAKLHPTVMFFPGAYTYSLESGSSLDLFEILHDDKYYRAFNIFNCEA
jgi:hypothetical protein